MIIGHYQNETVTFILTPTPKVFIGIDKVKSGEPLNKPESFMSKDKTSLRKSDL